MLSKNVPLFCFSKISLLSLFRHFSYVIFWATSERNSVFLISKKTAHLRLQGTVNTPCFFPLLFYYFLKKWPTKTVFISRGVLRFFLTYFLKLKINIFVNQVPTIISRDFNIKNNRAIFTDLYTFLFTWGGLSLARHTHLKLPIKLEAIQALLRQKNTLKPENNFLAMVLHQQKLFPVFQGRIV